MTDNAQTSVLFHCLHDALQMMLSRRNILKHDTVVKTLIFHQRIAHAIGIEEPSFHATVAQFLWILQIVAVFATSFIRHDDAECLEDNINPLM